MAGILRPLLRRLGVMPGWKMPLVQALAAASALNPLNYTAATWGAVASAMVAGQAVLDDPNATQQDVNDATTAINIAINNLVEWTPAEEFSNGELGVYFDPEDTSTLFQDSAGTTPVTGDGQPVGLMLDKSQGLELGPEQSTDYDSGDWYTVGNSPNQWQIDSANVISVDNTGGTTSCYLRSDNIGMVEGKTYRIEFEILTSNGIGGFRLTNATDNGSPVFLSTGPVSVIFKAGGTNVGIFGLQAYPDWVGSIGNISVKELPGLHAVQGTTSAKPTREGDGLAFDGVDDRMLAGTIDDFIWMHDGSPVTIGIVQRHELNNDLSQIVGTANRGASALVGINLAYESRDDNTNREGLACTLQAGITGSPVYSYSSTATGAGSAPAGQPLTTMLVYDDTEFVTYVNGVQESQANPSAEVPFPTGPSAYPLAIGSAGGGQGPMLGSIKALVIYNKHLTPDTFERFQHWLAKKAGITL